MTTTKTVECAFNEYWSLVWDHHKEIWALTFYNEDGTEDSLSVKDCHLVFLKELLLLHSP